VKYNKRKRARRNIALGSFGTIESRNIFMNNMRGYDWAGVRYVPWKSNPKRRVIDDWKRSYWKRNISWKSDYEV
jgi:uncharacterized heparinase superfamily protein